ncbi:bifunctional 4-hydroxy-2-oxoglutarate aldolase/2-dehydro-3-deoxy-phosphogluconate aldolase [Salinibius halmophilus]|uniref:bifunctional 4-hydroxy-2-oxoglutarate aldolase/2-dehydro-3-deoxy-phosphogluconate aldolase n=1 Tax=Salinibius halmophilus TaxID=1853216 RepID=UPI000E66F0FA|nr:bifunctional 4-hydroxy-2-oxoglutarate aldolase/2-dehydro-3-deoxy-phosphogluconate aldolase [Salinibius halmophilus]
MSSVSEQQIQAYGRIIPLVSIDQPSCISALVEAFLSAGMQSVEVTLRTPSALAAIAEFAKYPELKVIAGTVITPVQVNEALSAGADLLVSPGATDALLDAKAPLVPGVSTPSEVMQALAHGYHVLKAFPAGAMGGAQWLNAIAGPLPQAKFMATGGINLDNLAQISRCKNVVAIGGSWLASPQLIAERAWQKITDNCRQAREIVCS